jgi:hypothetical protein
MRYPNLAALLLAAPFVANAAALKPIDSVVWNFEGVSVKGLVTGDFNGDGRTEIAFSTRSMFPLLVVLDRQGGTWRTTQATAVEGGEGGLIAQPWTHAGGTSLVLVDRSYWWTPAGDSNAYVFNGTPLRMTRKFPIALGVTGAVVADADGDGVQELLVTTATGTFAHALPDGALLWSIAAGGNEVHVARLPGHAAPQIILASTPGRIFDGVTRVQQWSYPDGFGVYLASGRFASDGGVQFVGASDWSSFAVFRSSPWSPVWDFSSFDIDAIAAADLDGDGRDEILQGDGQWGDVKVIDSQTRMLRYAIPNPGYGMAAIAAADLTGDGNVEIAFAPGTTSFRSESVLHIASGHNGAALFDLPTRPGGVGALAVAKLHSDGRDKVIAASTQRGVTVRDLETGNVEFESPHDPWGTSEPFSLTATVVRVARADASGVRPVVLAGTASYDGRIVVFDPTNGQVRLRIGDNSNRPLGSRAITGAELFDFDGDGRDDIVVSTEARTTAASGVRLHAYSLQTGVLLWESIAMGSGFVGSHGLLVIPANGGTPALLVAVLPNGLRAFDAETRLLAWTLDADVRTAAYLPSAPDGPELLLIGADGVARHYDADLRTLSRSYALPDVTEVHVLPDRNELVLKTMDRLVVTDLDGNALAQSGVLGSVAHSASIATRERGNAIEIIAGTHHGYTRYLYQPGLLFEDGFEP